MIPLMPHTQIGTPHYRMRPPFKNSDISFVEIDFHHTPADASAHLKNGKTVQLGYVTTNDSPQTSHSEQDHEHNTGKENGQKTTEKNGGILHFFNQNNTSRSHTLPLTATVEQSCYQVILPKSTQRCVFTGISTKTDSRCQI